jgi:hypothetical protein
MRKTYYSAEANVFYVIAHLFTFRTFLNISTGRENLPRPRNRCPVVHKKTEKLRTKKAMTDKKK